MGKIFAVTSGDDKVALLQEGEDGELKFTTFDAMNGKPHLH